MAITDCKSKEQTVQKEGVEKFKTNKIQNIGSTEWKQFIQAAEKFAKIQSENEYPEIGDNCLLCQQTISDDVPKNLISSYWAYIKSVSEQEAKIANENLAKIKKDYEDLDFNQFSETDTLTVWLKEEHETDLTKFKEVLKKQKLLSQELILNINYKKDLPQIEMQFNLTYLDTITKTVDKEIKAFEKDEHTKKLSKLLKPKIYLAHKEKLKARYADIKTLHKNLSWVNKANKFNKQNYKTQSTKTEKRLSEEYFNTDYINTFYDECEKLDGKFGVEIDAKSSDGQSNRQLFIKGKDPSAILSEGEQKVIALADFIAETNITTINKGVIFDDPVNSLDDTRKKSIAKRLVELSKEKQSIVFTHDLVFVSHLTEYTGNGDSVCHWMESADSEIGKVHLDNCPSLERFYKTSRIAQKYLNKAKNAPAITERESNINNGFGALRTSYESLVVFGLFNGVVQRFKERVSIDSLNKVVFNLEIRDELLDGFKECCRYMKGHLHSDKYAYKHPTIENFNEEINRFDCIKTKIKDFKSK